MDPQVSDTRLDLFIFLSDKIGIYPIAEEILYLLLSSKKVLSPESSRLSDEKLLQAFFSSLWNGPKWFQNVIDLSGFIKFLSSKKCDILWMVLQCLRFISKLNDEEFKSIAQNYISQIQEVSVRLKLRNIFKNSSSKLDIDWLKHFDRYTIDVEGVSLTKYELSTSLAKQDFILIPSAKKHLRSIAQSIAKNRPVIVQGPLGSCKTKLIEYIASQTGRNDVPHLTKIQIGNQIDSKLLIGSYCCTEIPGEFIWKPGPLTQALLKGYWILFEDIDLASSDVLTLLNAIIKNKCLEVLPGYHAINSIVDPRFRIFFTRRTIEGYSEFLVSPDKDKIIKLCDKVITNVISEDELEEIIISKWPNLKPIISRILKIYTMLLEGFENKLPTHGTSRSSFRKMTLRDLLKWCNRISPYFQLILSNLGRECCLLDAADCFLQSLPNIQDRLHGAELVGVELNIAERITHQIYCERWPEIKNEESAIIVGRTKLPKCSSHHFAQFFQPIEPFFAKTQQTLLTLERIASCVFHKEPILLVGETGTGKTSTIQYLCRSLNRHLIVVNMNQQSDTCDLLGGYKPVDLKFLIEPIHNEFHELFKLSFVVENNNSFLRSFNVLYRNQNWNDFFKVIKLVQNKALQCKSRTLKFKPQNERQEVLIRWSALAKKVAIIKQKCKQNLLAFSYIEGTLVKAMRNGDWILLDEINLAEPETLQCLSEILDSDSENVYMLDKVDGLPVKKHSDFRLFACMNPSTDIGKKDLPLGIRNRFTEFFIEELENENDLKILVTTYLEGILSTSKINKIVDFYLKIKNEAKKSLKDANDSSPHYSLRTLCRSLRVVTSIFHSQGFDNLQKLLYEAFCLSFLTQLDSKSYEKVERMILKNIIDMESSKTIKNIPMSKPKKDETVNIEGFWISKGANDLINDESYILTTSVIRNLQDICRIVSFGQHYPILIQGETSVGKTSLIKYLAQRSGNVCLRVNNHEHTDIQEYVGSYTANEEGKLVFKEGVLVEAMKNGYWIILDELNLASTEVLESLNRVLDDNREIFIAETQETIKAHPKFLLFATQNPPGHYGGRKILSRAFRNRFIELHFDEIPSNELEEILQKRCSLPPSYSRKMVATLIQLRSSLHQCVSLSFAGKHGGVTLRDLFRWGERYRLFAAQHTEVLYDWNFHLAKEGYMLLAGRSRTKTEEDVILSVLKKVFNIKDLDIDVLFDSLFKVHLKDIEKNSKKNFQHIFWTNPLKRLFVLLYQAFKYNEPVLLVGDTGCGKTTICQLFASINCQELYSINCHMHSESSDFIGSLRPVRNEQNTRLFEWVDGPLVNAMRNGTIFLIDEISLADDSVLERLNSVIEPEKILLVSEKSTYGSSYLDSVIKAQDGFHLVATMNPGGDYGKKELSPALRNRFTEIWCYASKSIDDMHEIIIHNLKHIKPEDKLLIVDAITSYFKWHYEYFYQGNAQNSIRDILSLVDFINVVCCEENSSKMKPLTAVYHGLSMVLFDSLGTDFNLKGDNIIHNCEEKLLGICKGSKEEFLCFQSSNTGLVDREESVIIGPFAIKKGSNLDNQNDNYIFNSPTTMANVVKLFRAMQINKPILIEGTPGVGKTSLIQAIAKFTGYNIIRINLSEQTDVSDLFGADLPVEGQEGKFAWRDGPLLQALKKDSCWILLDELNLASQSVLEGLNACLDHRGEIFIPELAKTFQIEKNYTRIFACQNPHSQGGDRKGLPKSFINRFTLIFMEKLTTNDLEFIVSQSFPLISFHLISKMVDFNQKIVKFVDSNEIGIKGSPWEFNLRDIFRWCQVTLSVHHSKVEEVISHYMKMIYYFRFRCVEDRKRVKELFESIFKVEFKDDIPIFKIFNNVLMIGRSSLPRVTLSSPDNYLILHRQLPYLEQLMKCIEMNWMALIVGSAKIGKTAIVNILANLTGNLLKTIVVNSETDTVELLGGFEQREVMRDLKIIEQYFETKVLESMRKGLMEKKLEHLKEILIEWNDYKHFNDNKNFDYRSLLKRLDVLEKTKEKIEKLNISFENLKLSISDLRKQISKKKSLSSSGTFHWIDSVLVNSLREGNWLLIDEVNLCPASVLDRLNGLLEPRGFLIMNEQGSIDGDIPLIRPHPNFRLILAMDPKNGELSRAMRNRGIEIYMLNESNERDTRMILHSKRINLPVTDFIISLFDNPYIDQLCSEETKESFMMDTVKKLIQLENEGLDLKSAINVVFENHIPNDILNSLVNDEKMECDNDLSPKFWCDFENYSLKSILGDVILNGIERESLLYDIICKNKDFISELNKRDDYIVLLYASFCVVFFGRSSKNDFDLRVNICKEKIDNCILPKFIERIKKFLESIHVPQALIDLPIDSRYLKYNFDGHYDGVDKDQIEHIYCKCNQLWLNLFWAKCQIIENDIFKKSNNSLEILSRNVNEKKIDIKELPFEGVKWIHAIVENLKTLLHCKLANSSINDEQVLDFMKIILWIHSFIRLVYTNCKTHNDYQCLHDKLIVIWAILTRKLRECSLFNSFENKVYRKFTGSIGLKSDRIFTFYDCKLGLSICFDIFDCEKSAKIYIKSREMIKVIIALIDNKENLFECRTWLNSILKIYILIQSNDFLRSEEIMDEIEISMRSIKKLNHLESEEENDSELIKSFNINYKIENQLIPLIQLIFIHNEINFCVDGSATCLKNINTLKNMLYLDPMHMLALARLSSDQDFRRILMYYHYYSLRSFSLKRIINWLNKDNDQAKNENVEDEWLKESYTFECSPIITLVASSIMLQDIKLGIYSSFNNQLFLLKDFFLNNFHILFSNDLNLIQSHCNAIKTLFSQLEGFFLEVLNAFPSLKEDLVKHLSLLKNCKFDVDLCLYGLIISHILAPLQLIDPLEKWCIKLEQYKLELYYYEVDLKIRHILNLMETSGRTNNNHPLVNKSKLKMQLIKEKIQKLSKKQGYRPFPSQFQKLRNDVKYFCDTVIAIDKIWNIVVKIKQIRDKNLDPDKKFIIEILTICKSIENFNSTIHSNYPLYGNITNGFCLGLSILFQGLKIEIHHVYSRMIIKQLKILPNTFEFIKNLTVFACTNPCQRALNMLKLTKMESFRRMLDNTKSGLLNNLNRLHKAALYDLKNGILLCRNDKKSLSYFFSIINGLCVSWSRDIKEKSEIKKKQENLFEYRKRHEDEIPEELKENIEIAKKFPSYYHLYRDMINDLFPMEQESEEQIFEDFEISDKGLILNEDIMDICNIHEHIMDILLGQQKCEEISFNQSTKYRYEVASDIINLYGPLFGSELDFLSFESNMMMLKIQSSSEISMKTNKCFNFYKDAMISELKDCFEVLEKVKDKICKELLPQFPGHPLLKQILYLINRLFGFNVTSPLAKFITGLELLTKLADNWETIAHKGIKLAPESSKVTEIIIKWRKLELESWHSTLEAISYEINLSQLSQFWFHFYSIIHSIMSRNDLSKLKVNNKENHHLLSLLIKFMEDSTLGEFSIRLHLIKNFERHLLCIDRKKNNLNLWILLNNIYHFYNQFEGNIKKKLEEEKKPIEKELKEFIKIMKWNPGNFWDFKNKVDKSHKTLHRLSKRWEASLKKQSRPEFNSNDDSILKVKESEIIFDITKFKILKDKNKSPKNEFILWRGKKVDLIYKIKKYSLKCLLKCKIIRTSIKEVHNRINDFVDVINELKNQQIITHKDKEEYRKDLRRIKNIKRQSFSHLLKNLIEMGIRYKRGIEYFSNLNFENIILNSEPLEDSESNIIKLCNDYFYKILARILQLQDYLSKPSEDLKNLGGVFSFIKGISGATLENILFSRKSLFNCIKHLNDINSLMINFEIIDDDIFYIALYKKYSDKLLNRISSLRSLLIQLKESDLYFNDQFKFNQFWINDHLTQLEHITDNLLDKNLIIISLSMSDKLKEYWSYIEVISFEILKHNSKEYFDSSSTILNELKKLCKIIIEDYQDLKINFVYDESNDKDIDKYITLIRNKKDRMTEIILIEIQKIYKAFQDFNTKIEGESLIYKTSINLYDHINLNKLGVSLRQYIISCSKIIDNVNNEKIRELIRQSMKELKYLLDILRILIKYLQTLSFFCCLAKSKLLYIILGYFVFACSKGLCLPPELEDEKEKDKWDFKDLEDAGLDDGEGINDISEKVENEIDLEDTFSKGQENTQEPDDKKIENEEKGIEMSEDFEGEPFSPEMAKDNEESGEENEEEDELDRKMGEVNNEDDEDILDKRMWGDEDDEEDEEDEDDIDFDGGEGAMDEKIVAKDENKNLEENNEERKNNENNESELDINELEGLDDEYEGEKEDPYKKNINDEINQDEKYEEEFPENIDLDRGEVSEEESEHDDENKEKEKSDIDETEVREDINIDEEKEDIPVNNPNVSQDLEDLEDKNEESENGGQINSTINLNNQEMEQILENNNRTEAENGPCFGREDNINMNGVNESDGIDKEGKNQSEIGNENEMGEGKIQSKTLESNDSDNSDKPDNSKPKIRTGKRSLLEDFNNAKRKKILEKTDDNLNEVQMDIESYMLQHEEKGRSEGIDLANEDEARKSKINEEEKGEENIYDEEMKPSDSNEEKMNIDNLIEKKNPIEELGENKIGDKKDKKSNDNSNVANVEEMELEGDIIQTQNVQRGPETDIFTNLTKSEEPEKDNSWFDILFENVTKDFDSKVDDNRRKAWNECERNVASLVYQLCQQLQLVLEPMKASKLKGDFRSGKRLNMRKVIEYIASQYKKDKIWLRRVKPSKRQYQILLAVDDSSSMVDNHSKRMAFESIALLGKSLSLIEAGEMAVMSFGQEAKLLHAFEEHFTDEAGTKLLNSLTFDQKHTRVAELLNNAMRLFYNKQSSCSLDVRISQLLLILSDGRGLFREGEAVLRRAVRRIKDMGIFVVFVVLDNVDNKSSILDIKIPTFDKDGQTIIEPYMSKFPFPFYIIVRDINNMPKVLGEALRRWFEMVTETP